MSMIVLKGRLGQKVFMTEAAHKEFQEAAAKVEQELERYLFWGKKKKKVRRKMKKNDSTT